MDGKIVLDTSRLIIHDTHTRSFWHLMRLQKGAVSIRSLVERNFRRKNSIDMVRFRMSFFLCHQAKKPSRVQRSGTDRG
jgi:hypothetical protein